jgi:amino acid adenylation domain-containing protein/FkbM family methyltransferase
MSADQPAVARREELLRKAGERRRAGVRSGIPRRTEPGPAPLSYAQQRLWFLDQLEPASARYNVPLALRFTGVLHMPVLRWALDQLVRRHDVLRSRIDASGAEPVQAVAEDLPIELEIQDVSGEDVENVAVRELHRPFDLTRGPLLRANLLRSGPQDHTLLLAMHHMVTDGWSVELMTEELITLYRARLDGRPAGLPEPRVRYADYAVWQREQLSGDRLDRHLSHWRAELAGAPAMLELPADRPRPTDGANPAGRVDFEIDEHTSDVLTEFGRAEGATPHMTLLAAYFLLLWRYTGQTDLVVGTLSANRDRPELAGLVGFLVNMVPLRVRVRADGTFQDLVREVKRVSLAAYRHQALPFEKLVEELRPDRAIGRNPLFQAVFTLAHVGDNLPAPPGLQVSILPLPGELAKFDVVLGLRQAGARLSGTLAYSRDLFDADRMRSMAETFTVLLRRVAAGPRLPLAELDLISPQDRDKLTTQWQGATAALPDESVHRLVELQARRTPHAVAVEFGDARLTYGELDAWADGIACRLREAGCGRDAVVAVHAGRSLELVVGLLATLKAGAAFLALDPEVPAPRLAVILAEASPAAVLCAEPPPDVGVPVIALADKLVKPAGIPHSAHDEQLAYVVYTSGSTGRPKGAQNTHRGLANRLAWMQRIHRLGAGDAVLQKTPTSFDVSVWEFLLPLITGARLVLAAPGGHRDPDHLADVIHRHAVTTVHFVPSMLRVFLDSQDVAERCTSLRTVTCSGEALAPDLQRRCHELLPWVRLYNLYGPAEAAIDVTWHECLPTDSGATVPIGRPIANTRVYVCDEALRLVPVGVPGELYLGGAGIGRGYLGRPDLTAERFVPDPFGPGGQRLYRTGDRARVRADGELEFLGRVDRQVKLRGVRVEPGEIEARLRDHDGVQEVAVLARPEGSEDHRLVAYVVPDDSTAAVVRRLISAAADDGEHRHRLPNGMEVLHHNVGETDFTYGEIFTGDGYLRHGVTVAPGDVVFDVGANIGLFSLFVAARCPQASIYAFEPIPATFDLLRRNLAVYAPNANALPCGLSDRPRTGKLTYYPGLSIISGAHADQKADRELVRTFAAKQSGAPAAAMLEELLNTRLTPEKVNCDLRTVSQMMRQHNVSRIDLLKVDVEKSEAEVLGGIEDDDWQAIRQVVVEVHDLDGRLADVTGLLRRHGFEVVADQEDSLRETGLYTVYARRCDENGRAADVGRRAMWLGREQFCDDIRAYAGQHLPAAMVPATVVPLLEMPLSANGKLDYKALPEPQWPRSGRRAPVTATERELTEIWQQILGGGPVGVDDDFFDLGGHSLLGLRLLGSVERKFGMKLPVTALFGRMTVAGLAARLDALGHHTESSLVPLRAGGDKPPLFCVHAMDGSVSSYRDLVASVDERVPMYGLRATGPATGKSVVDMAAENLKAIREVFPGGPWRLLGWSFGGLVAYEMARQLTEAGEQVELLALVDTSPPAWFAGRGNDESSIRAEFSRQVKIDGEHLEPLLDVFTGNWIAATTFVAEPYPGSAVLLKTGSPEVLKHAEHDWSQLCQGGVRLVAMPCDHFGIVKPPYAALVARHLQLGES